MGAGYASSAFVSDMSTGFSGNLGFPIPAGWNYDQFAEISGYRGKWDLDKVAYSGRWPAIGGGESGSIQYQRPAGAPKTEVDSLQKVSDFIPLVKQLETQFKNYINEHNANAGNNMWLTRPAEGVMSYIGRSYFSDAMWVAAAGTDGWPGFDEYLKRNAPGLRSQVAPFIARDALTSDGKGGVIDLAHLAAAGYSYLTGQGAAPRHWTNWGGDLVTGASNIHTIMQANPSADRQEVANGVIGAHRLNTAYLSTLNLPLDGSACSLSDLNSDGDAIRLAETLKADSSLPLNAAMTSYYKTMNGPNRYSAFYTDIPRSTSVTALAASIYSLIHDWANYALVYLKARDVTNADLRAASRALANFLLP